MLRSVLTLVIGLASGVLSGAFGTGGGATTTIAIRLFLDAPALAAVATPLPVLIPGAVVGTVSYVRARIADLRAGVLMGIGGGASSVLGAWLAVRVAGGEAVLLATAALMALMAASMALGAMRAPSGAKSRVEAPGPATMVEREGADDGSPSTPAPAGRCLGIGAATGLLSGFLGLGGGFILVPLMTRLLSFDMKRAIGTSLVAIAIIAVPGTLTYAALGEIDWLMVPPLAAGVMLGTWLGSKGTMRANDRWLRLAFAALLMLAAAFLVVRELGGLPVFASSD